MAAGFIHVLLVIGREKKKMKKSILYIKFSVIAFPLTTFWKNGIYYPPFYRKSRF